MTGFSFKPHTFRPIFSTAIAAITLSFASTAMAQLPDTDARVLEVYDKLYGLYCQGEQGSVPEYQSWDLTYSYDYDPESVWDYRLYRLHCFNGAYNEVHVFIGVDYTEEIFALQFSVPKLDIVYKNDDYERSDYKMSVSGFYAEPMVVNSEFNPETGILYEFSKWRGMGDASNVGEWHFHEGNFVLKAYDVDASYDGKYDMRRVFGSGEPVR